jgi:DNA-binding MurR/RpiR family transcriptional regulator
VPRGAQSDPRKGVDLMLFSPHGVIPSSTPEAEVQIGWSRSTVIRLACALVYTRYPALQTAVRDKLFSYPSTVERMQRIRGSDDSLASVCRRIALTR